MSCGDWTEGLRGLLAIGMALCAMYLLFELGEWARERFGGLRPPRDGAGVSK